MTLTELKYIVAVAREKHFGKGADACHVSQPTLSVAIKKLEEELQVKLFERNANEITVTPLGEEIIRQAQSVLEQADQIKDIAKRGKDPLVGSLRLGVIYTIGPYLLPDLVRQTIAKLPQMPLMLQENFTVKLLEELRNGEIDCAILAEPFPDTNLAIAPLYDEPFMAAVPSSHPLAGALRLGVIYTIGPYLLPDLVRQTIATMPQMPLMLQENFTVRLLEELRQGEIDCAILAEPFPDTNLAIAPLYDEPFMAAVPSTHALAARSSITAEEIKKEAMLLLGNGHCFRDHVLEVCPEFARFSSNSGGIQKSFEGSSLETIKHMVAAGMGITLVPRLGVPKEALAEQSATQKGKTKIPAEQPSYIKYLPFEGHIPSRRVVLAWRRSFTRYEAIAALRNAIYACELPGVTRLS